MKAQKKTEEANPTAFRSSHRIHVWQEMLLCLITMSTSMAVLVHSPQVKQDLLDFACLVILLLLSVLCGPHVSASRLYRGGVDQGVLIGCATVPILLLALLIRSPIHHDVILFHLDLSIGSSLLILVDSLARSNFEELNMSSLLLSLVVSFSFHLRFPWMPILLSFLLPVGSLIIIRLLLRGSPQSFTLGEACILTNVIMSLTVDMISTSLHRLYSIRFPTTREMLDVDLVVVCLVFGTFLTAVVMSPFVMSREAGKKNNCVHLQAASSARRSLLFFALFGTWITCVLVPSASFLLRKNLLLWVLEHVSASYERLALLAYWFIVMGLSLKCYPPRHSSLPRTVIRKGYHVLALLLFCPGQLYQPEMLRLAYAAATALLMSLELIRASRIRPISATLERVVAVHADERDSGVFILTHIYLLVGCALPSWLTPYQGTLDNFSILEPLAGALIVGVGDTAASVCGKLFGRMRWTRAAGGSKTVEGTAAGILATTVACFLLWKLTGSNGSMLRC